MRDLPLGEMMVLAVRVLKFGFSVVNRPNKNSFARAIERIAEYGSLLTNNEDNAFALLERTVNGFTYRGGVETNDSIEAVLQELKSPYKLLGSRIKALRRSAGQSQNQFAKQHGFKQSDVSKWERGTTKPKQKNLNQLLLALSAKKQATKSN